MSNEKINNLLNLQQKIFEEIYIIDSIINLTKENCLGMEFKGEYYGTTRENSVQLSSERNNYINMLTILSERISTIKNLNLSAEQKTTLE